MSASSWLVTAGIMMALRSKFAPLIFLMRPISLRSMGPNLAKSTLGQGIRPKAAPSPPEAAGALAACALVCAAPDMTAWVKACTSASVMRPLRPEPLTSASGTPSSRANLRTEGDAWGKPTVLPPGAWAGAATAGAAAATGVGAAAGAEATAAEAAGAAATAAVTGAAAATVPSKMASRSPMLTVSPTLTLSSLSTPACEDGISIEALSDSTVMSDCSALMVSPGLTMTSITATSLKSPMLGTCTCMGPVAAGAAAATGAATGAGAAAATGAAAGAADSPAASTTNTTEPCLTLSPSATRISVTTPAVLDGISIEALSDSTVISDCSAFTVSPTLTINSMTVTSSKSPMSGT